MQEVAAAVGEQGEPLLSPPPPQQQQLWDVVSGHRYEIIPRGMVLHHGIDRSLELLFATKQAEEVVGCLKQGPTGCMEGKTR